MDRPLLVAVNGQGEAVEETETRFLREAVTFTSAWLTRLPPSSRWYGPCLTLRQAAGRSLARRHERQLRSG